MTGPDPDQVVPLLVRFLKILVLAMTLGTAMFLGVVVVMQTAGGGMAARSEGMPLLSYIALGFAGTSLVVRMIAPNLIIANARRRIVAGTWTPPSNQIAGVDTARLDATGDAGKLIPALVIQTVVGAAVIEGATVIAIVAYLLEGQVWTAAVAGALIVILAFQIPTEFKVRGWIENQLRQLEQERALRT